MKNRNNIRTRWTEKSYHVNYNCEMRKKQYTTDIYLQLLLILRSLRSCQKWNGITGWHVFPAIHDVAYNRDVSH